MKKLVKNGIYAICILLTAGFIVSCNAQGEINPRIDNYVTNKASLDRKQQLATTVWHERKIVWARFDDVETLTDSIVAVRHQQAQVVVDAMKACR